MTTVNELQNIGEEFFKSIFEQKGSNHLYISNEEDEDLLFSKLMTTVTQENPNDSQVLIKDKPADFPILQSENCHIHHHYGSWKKYLLRGYKCL